MRIIGIVDFELFVAAAHFSLDALTHAVLKSDENKNRPG